MTDKQFERIKKGLNFHSEGGVDNLCTMTETTLRAVLDDATKELEAQIEKMKCCENCKHHRFCGDALECKIIDCNNLESWELTFGVSN